MELNSVVIVPSKRKEPSSNPTILWYMRLGYINLNMINRLVKDRILDNLVLEPMPICKSCIEVKITKRPFPPKGNRSSELLELVHTDVCGPINIRAHGGYEYLSHLLMTTLDTDMFT